MMKGKPWTPSSLKAMGGTEGVGVAFLEETFSATGAPPEHRKHQQAARAVLRSLLPEAGTDIKGHMRSRDDLLAASGYATRPKDFDDLFRLLDAEIRLISPTDPEGKTNPDGSVHESASSLPAGVRHYQLTHDYLVPSLREWLTRKQRETRKGRAELLLADRTSVWHARPENRQLPTLWQWCGIRWWTESKHWTPSQRVLMRRADRYHARRGLLFGAVLAIVALAGWSIQERVVEQRNGTHAAGLVRALLNADTPQVPALVAELSGYRNWADPLLRDELGRTTKNSREELHSRLHCCRLTRPRWTDSRNACSTPRRTKCRCFVTPSYRTATRCRNGCGVRSRTPRKEANRNGCGPGRRWRSTPPPAPGGLRRGS